MKKQSQPATHCGFVAIVGRPNVGKSTLFNAIIGHRLSITAQKPQTTRHQILGVKTFENNQMVFLDTPGLTDEPGQALHHYMNATVKQSLRGVDVILFVVESKKWTEGDQAVLDLIQNAPCPVLLAINKVDEIKEKRELLPFIEQLNHKFPFKETVPLSALSEFNMDVLQQVIGRYLPESEFYFPDDVTTISSEPFLAAEIVREKLMRLLGQEVPYALTVETERFEVENNVLHVNALIWVEKEGQKKIVIGRKGRMLKRIGQKARYSMESLFGQQVHLQLWVKVKRGWSDDERALQRFGYKSS